MKCCDCKEESEKFYSLTCDRAANPDKPSAKTTASRSLCPSCAKQEAKAQGIILKEV